MSNASSTADQHGHHEGEAHVAPLKLYLGVFGALIFLTALTVGLSYVHLGALNLAVAVIIASIKAALVLLFFMHLSHEKRFISIGFVSSLGFIGVFFAYTMNDTEHRANELNDVSGVRVYLGDTEKQAPGGFVPPERGTDNATPGEHQATHADETNAAGRDAPQKNSVEEGGESGAAGDKAAAGESGATVEAPPADGKTDEKKDKDQPH